MQNIALAEHRLVLLTWGNVSAVDRASGLVVIKPSGVSYDNLKPADMVVLTLGGDIVEGALNPSSDTPTHLELYRQFKDIGGIVHTHSTFATAWAQVGRAIPPFGTTHADSFFGAVPCTRALTQSEVERDYELNTGKVICETLRGRNCMEVPAAIVKSHGAFCWGETAEAAVKNAVALEEIAKTAYLTETLNPGAQPVPDYLLDKHYRRKHGKNAYYGQR